MAGAEIVVDNLLCFLTTAKADFSGNSLFDLACCFYSYENIKQSKTVLANLLHKDISWRRDPEKKKKELKDVTDWTNELQESKVKVKFVSDSYKGMPPVGLDFIGPLISNLSDEVTKINNMLPNFLDIKSEVRNTADTVRQLKVEMKDMNKKFSSAVAGIEEAANDLTQDDINIISDLRTFRNSMDAGRSSFGAFNLNRDPSSHSEVLKESTDVSDRDVFSVTTKVSDPSTGAISKEKRSENKNSRSSVPVDRHNKSLPSPLNAEGEKENIEISNKDGDGWTLVTGRKHRRARSSGNPHTVKASNSSYRLLGARKVIGTTMRAVRRTADVFLGRVAKDVTVDGIKDYVKDNFNINVQTVECLKIQSEHFNAFKVTVFMDERDILFNAELWPEGIIVNKFYKRRN